MHRFLLLCSAAVTLLAGCAVPLPKSRLSLDQYLSLPRPSLVDLARAMETTSNVERRDVLKAVLGHRRVPYTVHSYVAGAGTGENFIFEVGEGRRTVIFTAHHDTYPSSPGANDDASCIAAILAAYERLRASPPRNLMVRFIIFDGEERRLEGSRSYAAGRNFDDVIGVYAYELCGIGTRVNLWDVVSDGLKRSEIFTQLVEVLEEGGIPFVVRGAVTTSGRGSHSSDHAAFREADPPIPGLAVTILPDGLLAQLRPFDY